MSSRSVGDARSGNMREHSHTPRSIRLSLIDAGYRATVPSIRSYAFLGATGGAAVTAAFWFGIGEPTPWTATACLIGAAIGAAAGVLAGDGSVQEAWKGWTGALIIPPIFTALLNAVVIAMIATQSH
jgi:hypothetical protein